MGLTSTLFTALSGLNVNQLELDVTGNNIANVNTVGFKASTVSFESQFSQTFSFGSGPTTDSGGQNPTQIGLGTVSGPTQRDMSAGQFETTNTPTDLAINGSGWFIVQQSNGTSAYTRDGEFMLNGKNQMVDANGDYVMGYQVDSNFSVIPGSVGELSVPLGKMSAAGASANATFGGNLDSNGTVASTGAVLQTQDLTDSSTSAAITTGSLLTNVESGATHAFAVGDTLTLNTSEGGRTVPTATYTVTASSKVSDLANYFNGALGIDPSSGAANTAGTTVNAAGQIVITGNTGTVNDLDIQAGDLVSSNAANSTPLTFTKAAAADGTSTYSTADYYDSTGAKVITGISMTLASTSGTGTTWQWVANSPDSTGGNSVIGQGTLTFNNNGQLMASTGGQVNIDRQNTGAQSPLKINYNFGSVTSLATSSSSLTLNSQDGFAVGTLTQYSIGQDGTITGTFSNGQTKTLGQVALATFANESGLVSQGSNQFIAGPNSGTATISAPTTGGTGTITSGALELSNVDLSREFTNLIVASTGFSAASKVISSSNQLLNELLQTVH